MIGYSSIEVVVGCGFGFSGFGDGSFVSFLMCLGCSVFLFLCFVLSVEVFFLSIGFGVEVFGVFVFVVVVVFGEYVV